MFHLVLNCYLSLFARISDKKGRLSWWNEGANDHRGGFCHQMRNFCSSFWILCCYASPSLLFFSPTKKKGSLRSTRGGEGGKRASERERDWEREAAGRCFPPRFDVCSSVTSSRVSCALLTKQRETYFSPSPLPLYSSFRSCTVRMYLSKINSSLKLYGYLYKYINTTYIPCAMSLLFISRSLALLCWLTDWLASS